MTNDPKSLPEVVAELLNEYGMAEVVAVLAAHSRFFHETLRENAPGDSMEWLGWNRDLTAALRNAEDEEEAEEMVSEQLAVIKRGLSE